MPPKKTQAAAPDKKPASKAPKTQTKQPNKVKPAQKLQPAATTQDKQKKPKPAATAPTAKNSQPAIAPKVKNPKSGSITPVKPKPTQPAPTAQTKQKNPKSTDNVQTKQKNTQPTSAAPAQKKPKVKNPQPKAVPTPTKQKNPKPPTSTNTQTTCTILVHGGTSFQVKNAHEKGNVDYIRVILAIVQEALTSVFPDYKGHDLAKLETHLSQLGVSTQKNSPYWHVRDARNYFSHIDYDSRPNSPLHKTTAMQELFEKSIEFIQHVESKSKLDDLQRIIVCLQNVQLTYSQHKIQKITVTEVSITTPNGSYVLKNPHHKTKLDIGRVLTLMVGTCVSNSTIVSPAKLNSIPEKEKRALSGIDAYYWCKWGSLGYLEGKNGKKLDNSSYKDIFAFLKTQRVLLYHPESSNSLPVVSEIYKKLAILATDLDDSVTLTNLVSVQKTVPQLLPTL